MKIIFTMSASLFIILFSSQLFGGGLSEPVTMPPKFLYGVGEELVIYTSETPDLRLECEGMYEIFWDYPNTTPSDAVLITNSSHLGGNFFHRSELLISNAYSSDTGYYSCRYKDRSMNDTTYVYVDDGKYDYVLESSPLTISATTSDEFIVFDCRTTNPRTNVTLTKGNDKPVNAIFEPRKGFILENLSVSMTGQYTCTIHPHDRTRSFLVSISAGVTSQLPVPTISYVGHGHFVVGHAFRLTCIVAHNKPVTFEWTHLKDFTMPPAQTVSVPENTKVSFLDVTPEKADIYGFQCQVSATNCRSNFNRINVTVVEQMQSHLNVTSDISSISKIKEGEKLFWKSTVDAFPGPVEVTYFNPQNRPVNNNERVKTEFHEDTGEAWLNVEKLIPTDFGVWRLDAVMDSVKKSTQLNVFVSSAPQVQLILPTVVPPNSGVKARCQITAFPLPGTFVWQYADHCGLRQPCSDKDFTNFPPLNVDRRAEGNQAVEDVVLPNFNSSRVVRCSCKNEFGGASRNGSVVVSDLQDRWVLQIEELPKSINDNYIEVVENDNFTVLCGATTLFFNSPTLLVPGNLETNTTVSKYSESIRTVGGKASMNNRGEYVCSVNDFNGRTHRRQLFIEVKEEIQLALKEAANVWMDDEAKLPVEGGKEFEVNCEVEGRPQPTIVWKKDGYPLEFDESVVLGNNGQIVYLRYFKEENVGLYQCELTWRNSVRTAGAELYLRDPMSTTSKVMLGIAGVAILILILAAVYLIRRLRHERAKSRAQKEAQMLLFEAGDVKQLNPDILAEEQADLLPYDKSYEIDKNRIIIGRQLGSGAFGRVVKAEVIGLKDGEEKTEVAVKMSKCISDPSQLRNLAIELKIMIHLGKHLNIVNLVGAYTANIVKGELWLLVEYCRYGDLLTYLHRYRRQYINQIDPITDAINYKILTPTYGKVSSPRSQTAEPTARTSTTSRFSESTSGYLIPNTRDAFPLSDPPKGRHSNLATPAGDGIFFAANPGYGKMDESTVGHSENSPLSPILQYNPSEPVPSSPTYINMSPNVSTSYVGQRMDSSNQMSPTVEPLFDPKGVTSISGGHFNTSDPNTSGVRAHLNSTSSTNSSRFPYKTDMTMLTSLPMHDSQGMPMSPMDFAGIAGTNSPFTTTTLICWAWQVARGMDYLSSRRILHGDLAARNLLLAEDNVVKISDFGLSRDIYKKEAYTKLSDDLLPIKWMSIEAIRDRRFSIDSDIWAFGIVLWELFSLGQAPYPGVDVNMQFLTDLEKGLRNLKPKNSNNELFDLMQDCWSEEPDFRPRFNDISLRLENMLKEDVMMNFSSMNETYMRMNSDYFRSRTDYLSLLTSPEFNKMHREGSEPRYSNLPVQDESKANYLSMDRNAASVSDKDSGYLAAKTASVPPELAIFSPNPVEAREQDRFMFHSVEDLPPKVEECMKKAEIEGLEVESSEYAKQKTLSIGNNKRIDGDDESEQSSLLSEKDVEV